MYKAQAQLLASLLASSCGVFAPPGFCKNVKQPKMCTAPLKAIHQQQNSRTLLRKIVFCVFEYATRIQLEQSLDGKCGSWR